ncbi:MAG: saccharopine dehydrogenase NADP-binding domain-containing protein [Caldisericia bacterium]|nr:saccharopine dehydrogenase NADP-binding domain-containing protein [Caldisericia bacterium]
MKVTVLGGCGTVGSVAVETLSSLDFFSEIVVADINREKGEKLSSTLKNVSFREVDANDEESVKSAIEGSDVVLNTIGPFFKFGPKILKAVIEKGINYVDICDDFDATERQLEMDEEAKKRGVSALIGMGSSPGFANVLVRFANDYLFDEMTSVDIYHAHGGEKTEGAAVVRHRIHSMLIDIPAFLDGEFKTVRIFDKSGEALEEDVDMCGFGKYRVYAYPHPETITLPRVFKSLKRVTNLGIVLPPKYAELIKGFVKLGVTSEEPIDVNGRKIKPIDFAVSFILSRREKFIKDAGITEPIGCLKIVIKGKKDGRRYTYIFSVTSKGAGMEKGTGIPAALGALLMGQGKIKEKGVFPPEKGVNPIDVLEVLSKKIKLGEGGKLPVEVERIDETGKKEKVDVLKFLPI